MPRPRWKPKTKRRHEDTEISNWQSGGSGDKENQKADKQLKNSKAPPDNLGCRQLALNTRVNDAFTNQVNFDDTKNAEEATELDRLFKIDLAAKLKNVDYIIDTLKSGDSLYTARALKKCEWLFGDEHQDIINPDYLNKNVFPGIALRMKRKILKAAAKNVTNPDRAAQFYYCCMKEKMSNTACTCLLYTTEAFKIDILRSQEGPKELRNKNIVFIRFLVRKSFDILKVYLDYLSNSNIDSTFRNFRNLYYSVSNEKYLDMAETLTGVKFDLKLSEDIMKNFKDRVLAKPKFYINTLNAEVLVKYSTVDDVKVYATAILPDTGSEFWHYEYYEKFRHIFEIIPENETYEFFRKIFLERYSDTDFEMHVEFYDQKFYTFMTADEKQEWAFRHLQSQKQILGVKNDYIWYKFIKFEFAFPAVKDLINITSTAHTRNRMTQVLVESAQNDRELETLFIYYHKRHLNESRSNRDEFLKEVIEHHNVLKFDKPCWKAFEEILLTLDPYNKSDTNDKNIDDDGTYKTITLLYHILNKEPFSDELMKFFLEDFNVYHTYDYLEDVGPENYKKLHDFFFDVYMEKVAEYKRQPYTDDVAARVDRYFRNIMSSMGTFHNDDTKIKHESNHQKTRIINTNLSDRQLLRDLKKNKTLVIRKVDDVKMEIHNRYSPFRLKNFLNKIKIYFPEDVTKTYLKMFEGLVNENKDVQSVRAGVHGIFDLGDSEAKIDFMKKYAPDSGKLDRKTIDIGQLRTQRAICQYASISRPPLPIQNILLYIKGSYAKFCLNVFNTYLAILPLPMCLEFVHSLIDAPISIQKHAIRLAFQCFSAESLIKVITDLWENTKNVSMRNIIYKALFHKVVDSKNQMYMNVLLNFTMTLHQNDENEIFDIVVSNKVSEEYLGDYIEAVWKAVGSFEDKQPNIKRKENVIRCIQGKLHLLKKSFVLAIIEEHLNVMISENKLSQTYAQSDMSRLHKENWRLLARFIVFYTSSKDPFDEYVRIVRRVVQNSIDKWVDIDDDEFFHQTFLTDFYSYLEEARFKHKKLEDRLPIFEEFLYLVKSSLPIHDTYKLTWELELAVLSRKTVIDKRNCGDDDRDNDDFMFDVVKYFSKAVGDLVSVYANNGMYVMSYSSYIKEIVEKHAKNILYAMFKFKEYEYLDEVLLTLAYGIVQFDTPETYMLAIQLLSTDSEDEEDFAFVIDKVQKCSHPEVKLALYIKFREYCYNNSAVNEPDDIDNTSA